MLSTCWLLVVAAAAVWVVMVLVVAAVAEVSFRIFRLEPRS
jgi:hypothetical protein